MMILPKYFSVILAVLIIGACSRTDGDKRADGVQPVTIHEVTISEAASIPTHEPNLTVGPDSVIYLSWIEEDSANGQHHFRFSRLDGEDWSQSVTIASGDDWFVNWADVPSLHVSDSTMTAHWLQKNGASTYSYGVRLSQSRDGGDTWSEPVWLHDDESATEHGFVSFAHSGDKLAAAWLDGRKYAEGNREMTVRSRIVGNDGSLSSEVILDDRACDCCPVSMAATTDGRFVVAYRDRSDSEIRDISTAFFDGSVWHEPVTVHHDNWMIAGCPVNGPAIHVDDATASIAWFTAADDSPRVNFATGPIDGRSYSSPLRIDLGNPVGRVDIAALPGDASLVVWMENRSEAGRASIMARRVADGKMSDAITIGETSSGRGSGFPKVAVGGDSIVFAWTQTSDTRTVKTKVMSTGYFN